MVGVKSIFPEGEALRSAARWISRMHRYDLKSIEEACQRYDLTPVGEEFLIGKFLHADIEERLTDSH